MALEDAMTVEELHELCGQALRTGQADWRVVLIDSDGEAHGVGTYRPGELGEFTLEEA